MEWIGYALLGAVVGGMAALLLDGKPLAVCVRTPDRLMRRRPQTPTK